METETRLGKLVRVRFGIVGNMIGLHVTISGKGWGVEDSTEAYDKNRVKYTEHCNWSESTRNKDYITVIKYMSDLLADAKVETIDQLEGMPVEATLEGRGLKSWRILTEVI